MTDISVRLTPDTNLFVAAALLDFGVPLSSEERAREAMRAHAFDRLWVPDRFRIVISNFILDEAVAVLCGRFGLPKPAVLAWLAEFRPRSTLVDPESIPMVCRNTADNHILAAAAAGGAELIVTADRKDLVDLHSWNGIVIVSVERFLQLTRR